MYENNGIFSGHLDPEGRPWKKYSNIAEYAEFIDSIIKTAALTQIEFFIPVGYFFDNPGLQYLIFTYNKDNVESKAFKKVFKDLIRVTYDKEKNIFNNDYINWREYFKEWLSGSFTNRETRVYLNILEHSLSSDILKSPKIFTLDNLSEILGRGYHYDLQKEIIESLEKLELEVKTHSNFAFSEIFKKRYLNSNITFGIENEENIKFNLIEITKRLEDKGHRLSRSILRDNQKLKQIYNIDEKYLFKNYDEYLKVVNVLNQYHQISFCEALGNINLHCPIVAKNEYTLSSRIYKNLITYSEFFSKNKSIPKNLNFDFKNIGYMQIEKMRVSEYAHRFRKIVPRLHNCEDNEFEELLNEYKELLIDSLKLKKVNNKNGFLEAMKSTHINQEIADTTTIRPSLGVLTAFTSMTIDSINNQKVANGFIKILKT